VATTLPSDGSLTDVVSFTIDPSFSGNLLLEASGFVSFGGTSGASCQPYVDGTTVGGGITADTTSAGPTASLATTGATAVSAGSHTVTVKCRIAVALTSPTVAFDAFAIVASS
jgi:hypothetical protein